MAFLRIALVLAALVVCSLAAPKCGSGGAIDAFQSDICNCFSGWAPSNTDGVDCSTHPKCAAALPESADTLHSNAPRKPKTTFAFDMLEITQQVPIVQGRKSAWISFMVPAGFAGAGESSIQTCNYPGVLWNKTVDSRDCIDEYRASIPWSQNAACGFVKNVARSVNNTLVYSTTLVTTVVETYKAAGSSFERLSTTSYLISVSFLAQKTFQSGTFSVSMPSISDEGVLSKYVISNSLYNPEDGQTLITVVTTTMWPYAIEHNLLSVAGSFDHSEPAIDGTVEVLASSGSAVQCTSNVRSKCTQQWTVTINSTECNLEGQYFFNLPVVCRDVLTSAGVFGSCPAGVSTVPLTLKVGKTDLCDSTPVDTSQSNLYTLAAFSDAAHTLNSQQFQVGDTVYWTFDIVNPFVSIKSVSFNNIKVALTTNPTLYDELYDSANGGIMNSGVEMVASEASDVIVAGQTGTLTFSYKLNRAALPATMASLSSSNNQASLVTSVVADIVYYGNNKRSVLMELSAMSVMSAASDSKSIRVVDPEFTEAKEQITEADASSASMVSAFSCLLLLAIAALF